MRSRHFRAALFTVVVMSGAVMMSPQASARTSAQSTYVAGYSVAFQTGVLSHHIYTAKSVVPAIDCTQQTQGLVDMSVTDSDPLHPNALSFYDSVIAFCDGTMPRYLAEAGMGEDYEQQSLTAGMAFTLTVDIICTPAACNADVGASWQGGEVSQIGTVSPPDITIGIRNGYPTVPPFPDVTFKKVLDNGAPLSGATAYDLVTGGVLQISTGAYSGGKFKCRFEHS